MSHAAVSAATEKSKEKEREKEKLDVRMEQDAPGPSWRQFSFWESKEVRDVQDLGSGPAAFKNLTPPYILTTPHASSPLISSVSCILSSSDGSISILDHDFSTIRKWSAWESFPEPEPDASMDTAMPDGGAGGGGVKRKLREKPVALLERGGVLLGIAEDDHPSHFPILKIWNLMHGEKKSSANAPANATSSMGRKPALMRSVRIGTGSRGYPISCLAASANLSYLAIGLISGQVLLYRHLAQSLASAPTALSNFPKPRTVWEGSLAEPVTGLGFREPSSAGSSTLPADSDASKRASTTGLFITTPVRTIAVASVTGKGTDPRVLEETGTGLDCCSIDHEAKEWILARDEGITTYTDEGRKELCAWEGTKNSMYVHGDNIAIVCPPFEGSRNTLPGSPNAAKLVIFDFANKFIAYSSIFKEGVANVFSLGWGDVFAVSGDGKVHRLKEAPVSSKLESLYRKNLYPLALTLAKKAELDRSEIAAIRTKYADYLYERGDFEGAMAHFVKTLGSLQPSYVIRKYLDAQRIHSLITYLQALHAAGLATTDHTTLLLNCYTKTDDLTRLNKFLREETAKTDNDAELPFDLDTAIRVCRSAGFLDSAMFLARRYEKHQEYLQIQLEDKKDFQDALVYLRALNPQIARDNLLHHGKTMLDDQTEGTTDLLIDLCSGQFFEARERALQKAVQESEKKDGQASSSNYLSYFGYDAITGVFTGSAIAPSESKSSAAADTAEVKSAPPSKSKQTYEVPDIRPFFHIFLDHPEPFTRFLESVARIRWQQQLVPSTRTKSRLQTIPLDPEHARDLSQQEPRAIWNTLLELYLSAKKTDRAMQLLEQADTLALDPMHALMLCFSHQFSEGQLLLWEKIGMYEDILRYWMQRPEGESKVLESLNRYGPTNLQLYPQVLRYLSSSPAALTRHSREVAEILQVIDDERIMPPLAVVKLLSRNEVTTIGVVKAWLKRKLSDTRQDIESDKALVSSYRSETKEKLQDIANLASLDKPQVFQVTRCALCGGQLDLPAVHFMCKHSYHQRCLPDADPECPACARQYAVIREMRRNQQALADRHELFLNEVKEAEDGFSVIASAFGRGILTKRAPDEGQESVAVQE